MTPPYDLLLKGGEIIDPSQGLKGRRDVAFARGVVAAIEESIPAAEATEVFDVRGCLVTPGLIDIHGHYSKGLYPNGVDPDARCLPIGVTTAVDAGSTGWYHFRALRDFVMAQAHTRMYCFLNLSALGLTSNITGGELSDLRWAQVEPAVRCVEENRDQVLGIKVRIADAATGTENALPALKLARQAADQSHSILMVHVSGSHLPLAIILEHLRPGDIATHIFHGLPNGILDSRGRVHPEVHAAVQRGVQLDVAHATVHFDINVARAALDQGLLPHTLSTDIHNPPPGRLVYDLLGVMSTFLALGLPVEEVVKASTSAPAAAMGKGSQLGTLRVGSAGDAAVLELRDGDFTLVDGANHTLQAKRRFVPVMTVLGGRRWCGPYR
jgi:dihydroorotase